MPSLPTWNQSSRTRVRLFLVGFQLTRNTAKHDARVPPTNHTVDDGDARDDIIKNSLDTPRVAPTCTDCGQFRTILHRGERARGAVFPACYLLTAADLHTCRLLAPSSLNIVFCSCVLSFTLELFHNQSRPSYVSLARSVLELFHNQSRPSFVSLARSVLFKYRLLLLRFKFHNQSEIKAQFREEEEEGEEEEEMNGGDLELPPGFRFHPTDEELVTHYLCRKCASQSIAVPIIAEIDLYKFDPWCLPERALYGEKEWYFFSPRDRKYPNGSRPNRAAGSGYWKATGADKPVGAPKPVAVKKALVFYAGKAPRGVKTNWIMHEYRLADVDRSARKKTGLRLDDWVLCRIYNKKGRIEKQIDQEKKPSQSLMSTSSVSEDRKSGITMAGLNNMTLLRRPPVMPISSSATTMTDHVQYVDTSESVPRLVMTDSSCSGHVGSPEFTCEKEVQSQPKWKSNWEQTAGLDMRGFGHDENIESIARNPFVQYESSQFSPLQDMFMYWQKPF